jgi:hypothetical protein
MNRGMPDPELIREIRRLFRQPDSALAVFGVGPATFPGDWRRDALNPSLPMGERVRRYERELRAQLGLLAAQVDEFEGGELERLEAEGIAVLIAIRELWRHFPELDSDQQEPA